MVSRILAKIRSGFMKMRKRISSVAMFAGVFMTGVFGTAMQDAEAAGLVLDTAVKGSKVPIGPIVVLLYAGIGGICVAAGNSRDQKDKAGRKKRALQELEKAGAEKPDMTGAETGEAYKNEAVTGEAETNAAGKKNAAIKREEKAKKKADKQTEKQAAAARKAEGKKAGRKEKGNQGVSTETDCNEV